MIGGFARFSGVFRLGPIRARQSNVASGGLISAHGRRRPPWIEARAEYVAIRWVFNTAAFACQVLLESDARHTRQSGHVGRFRQSGASPIRAVAQIRPTTDPCFGEGGAGRAVAGNCPAAWLTIDRVDAGNRLPRLLASPFGRGSGLVAASATVTDIEHLYRDRFGPRRLWALRFARGGYRFVSFLCLEMKVPAASRVIAVIWAG